MTTYQASAIIMGMEFAQIVCESIYGYINSCPLIVGEEVLNQTFGIYGAVGELPIILHEMGVSQ